MNSVHNHASRCARNGRRQVSVYALGLCIWLGLVTTAVAVQPASTTVPPALEIEVIDAGVDPLGHPSVKFREEQGHPLQVDITPTILVLRYYYTGDREFQAQLLPGGPSILVVHDPICNEKRYVQVQLPPGAPRVAYTGRSIEFKYGFTSVEIKFRRFFGPSVEYVAGMKMSDRVAKAMHVEDLRGVAHDASSVARQAQHDATNMVMGTVLLAGDGIGQLLSPVRELVSRGPLGGLRQRLEARVEEHKANPTLPRSRDGLAYVPRFPSANSR